MVVDHPFDEYGRLFDAHRVLARTASVAVLLRVLTAYSTGLEAEVQVYWRDSPSLEELQKFFYGGEVDGLRVGFTYDRAGEVELLVPGDAVDVDTSNPQWN